MSGSNNTSGDTIPLDLRSNPLDLSTRPHGEVTWHDSLLRVKSLMSMKTLEQDWESDTHQEEDVGPWRWRTSIHHQEVKIRESEPEEARDDDPDPDSEADERGFSQCAELFVFPSPALSRVPLQDAEDLRRSYQDDADNLPTASQKPEAIGSQDQQDKKVGKLRHITAMQRRGSVSEVWTEEWVPADPRPACWRYAHSPPPGCQSPVEDLYQHLVLVGDHGEEAEEDWIELPVLTEGGDEDTSVMCEVRDCSVCWEPELQLFPGVCECCQSVEEEVRCGHREGSSNQEINEQGLDLCSVALHGLKEEKKAIEIYDLGVNCYLKVTKMSKDVSYGCKTESSNIKGGILSRDDLDSHSIAKSGNVCLEDVHVVNVSNSIKDCDSLGADEVISNYEDEDLELMMLEDMSYACDHEFNPKEPDQKKSDKTKDCDKMSDFDFKTPREGSDSGLGDVEVNYINIDIDEYNLEYLSDDNLLIECD